MGQRRHPRAITALSVTLLEGESATVVAKDLSLGGLFLLTDRSFELGAKVSLLLSHRDLRVTAQAEVARLEAEGVGMRFIPSATLQQELKGLLDSLFTDGAELDEQRRAPRLAMGVKVVWSLGEVSHSDQLGDLSLSGARVVSGSPAAIDERVLLYLPSYVEGQQAGGEVLAACGCYARVVRHTADGFGVAFDSPTPEFREAVSALRRRIRLAKAGA